MLLIRILPTGVLDIDKKDYENPQLCAEYTQDMYAYLRLVEVRIWSIILRDEY